MITKRMIQDLHAAFSRRDMQAAEIAGNKIRDAFDGELIAFTADACMIIVEQEIRKIEKRGTVPPGGLAEFVRSVKTAMANARPTKYNLAAPVSAEPQPRSREQDLAEVEPVIPGQDFDETVDKLLQLAVDGHDSDESDWRDMVKLALRRIRQLKGDLGRAKTRIAQIEDVATKPTAARP